MTGINTICGTVGGTCIRAASLAAMVLVCLAAGTAWAQDKDEGRIGAGQADKDDTRISAGEDKVPAVIYDLEKLPPAVRKTRAWLIAAARTGEIDALRPAIDKKAGTPAFSFGGDPDAIRYWIDVSRDGKGREVLAELLKVLSAGYTVIDPGTKDELYIWPYHAIYPLNRLTAPQEVELLLLLNPDEARTMTDSGVYYGYRAGISRDGVWQFFVAGD